MKKLSKKVEKEMTVRELATVVEQLGITMKQNIDYLVDTIEQFAIATKNNFDRVDARFDRLEHRMDVVENEIKEMKIDIKELRSDMNYGFNRFDREVLYIHENFVRKDQLQTLMLSTS